MALTILVQALDSGWNVPAAPATAARSMGGDCPGRLWDVPRETFESTMKSRTGTRTWLTDPRSVSVFDSDVQSVQPQSRDETPAPLRPWPLSSRWLVPERLAYVSRETLKSSSEAGRSVENLSVQVRPGTYPPLRRRAAVRSDH